MKSLSIWFFWLGVMDNYFKINRLSSQAARLCHISRTWVKRSLWAKFNKLTNINIHQVTVYLRFGPVNQLVDRPLVKRTSFGPVYILLVKIWIREIAASIWWWVTYTSAICILIKYEKNKGSLSLLLITLMRLKQSTWRQT